jgi:hypothetical protein
MALAFDIPELLVDGFLVFESLILLLPFGNRGGKSPVY